MEKDHVLMKDVPFAPETLRLDSFRLSPFSGSDSGLNGEISSPASLDQETPIYEVGAMINERYRMLEIVGRGGMGVVYRVEDTLHPERSVALKTIHANVMRPEHLGMFKVEFLTMSRLRHPNVAAVFDFDTLQDGHDHFFTMEFIDGLNLFRATEGKDWRDIVEKIVHVCRALSFVHSRKIIHFDLKPGNVLVDHSGHLKVLDFGVAGAAPRGSAGRVRGTPQFMAPELTDADAEIDHRADLYSLGIMIYQLLNRHTPFHAESLTDLIELHHRAPIIFEAEVEKRTPRWLREMVMRLCAKQPSDRFRSANAVIEEINRGGGFSFDIETEETRESYVLSSRFTGREHELEALESFMARQAMHLGECPAVALVLGESGIGKSRLMQELKQHGQLSRIRFLKGNCYEGGVSEYQPIAEILEAAVPLAENLKLPDLIARYGPELVKVHPRLAIRKHIEPSPCLPDSNLERLRLVERVSEFLVALADVTPCACYINDLQWAPPGAVNIITNLALRLIQRKQGGHTCSLALFGSCRDDEISGRPIEQFISEMRMRNEMLEVKLEPLSRDQSSVLIGSMLGIEAPPDDFVDRMMEETQGNPFFIEELMRALVSSGSVTIKEGRWAAVKIEDIAIPEGMAAVFLHRMELLPEETRTVLDILAIHGQPLSPRILEHIAGIAHSDLYRSLAHLQKQRLAVEVPGRDLLYRVSHDNLRLFLYGHLSEERRAALHLAVAEAIESWCGEKRSQFLGDLAHHYWHSGEAGQKKALIYSLAAGKQAKKAYANHQGIQFYERALQLLARIGTDGVQRFQILEDMGDLYSLTGRYSEARKCFNEILASTVTPIEKARLSRKIAYLFFHKGDIQGAIDQIWNAVRFLGHRRARKPLIRWAFLLGAAARHMLYRTFPFMIRRRLSDDARARLIELCDSYTRLSMMQFFVNPKEGLLCGIRAVNIAEKIGDTPESAHGYAIIGLMYGVMGLFPKAMDFFCQKALTIATRLNSPWHLGVAHLLYAAGLFQVMRQTEAMQHAYQARDLLIESGDMSYVGMAIVHVAGALRNQGFLRKSMSLCEEGLQLLERAGSEQMTKGMLNVIGSCDALLGDFDKAIEHLGRSIAICIKGGDNLSLSSAYANMGNAFLLKEDYLQAQRYLELSEKTIEELGWSSRYNRYCYHLLCRTLLMQLDVSPQMNEDEKKSLIERVKKLLKLSFRMGKFGHELLSAALVDEGIFYWLRGRHQRARKSFTRAIEVVNPNFAKDYAVNAHLQAGCFLSRGEGETAELGRSFLKKCIELAEESEMKPFADAARKYLSENRFD